jgi:beta-lactamase regulating signal transducer with metallopeptidase domain
MFWWLAENTALAAVLAGGVAVLCRWGRWRPAVQHALWLTVLVKLLTPPLVHWPWPLPLSWHSGEAGPAVVEGPRCPVAPQVEVPAAEPLLVAATLPVLGEQHALPPLPAEVQTATSAGADGPRQSALLVAAFSCWLLGTATVIALQFFRIRQLRRRAARGRGGPPELQEHVAQLAARVRVRAPATRVLADLASPLVWGGWRVQLLWPEALLGLAAERQRAVVVHELAHLRRRDHWVGWLLLLAACLYWWNPLFWYVRRQLQQQAELACDAWVVDTLPEARRAYAEALLEVVQQMSRVASPEPALGVGGRLKDLERRLIMILRERVPCRLPSACLAFVALLAVVAVPSWSLGQRETKDEVDKGQPDPRAGTVAEYGKVTRPVGQAPASESERRLQEVEQKLQALLKEVQALRGPAFTDKKEHAPRNWGREIGEAKKAGVTWIIPATKEGQQAVITLTRQQYPLPKGKAEACAAFLREHVKAPVLETSVQGDHLVVTTTPEVQAAIGNLIALVQGRPLHQGQYGRYYSPYPEKK